MAYFDLRSLNSQCKYLITVSTSHKGARYEGSFVFSTPTELHWINIICITVVKFMAIREV